ncbi:MAG: glutamate 5-kinase [Calditrichaeota bacterium]|nr:MAG: glutamate 5-kinase [Calditrichota bacterium]
MKLGSTKRLVVKVGTNTLTDDAGVLDTNYLKDFTKQLAKLAHSGHEVVLVSSGAVRVGMARLGIKRVKSLRESQAAAAVGQGLLIDIYNHLFQTENITIAQILLVADDFRARSRYLNARNTLYTLFEKKVIPIINENDTISAEEIKFGDNDNLAAQVTGLVNAGTLFFLSDVDGLHERQGSKLGERIRLIDKITPEVLNLAGKSVSTHSRGGMITKIEGARIATEGGAHTYIANGREKNVLQRILDGEDIGTHFTPQTTWRDSRKRWIGMSSAINGSLIVDDGANSALMGRKKSLLAAGIVGAVGQFQAGDIVAVSNLKGEEIARGLVNYSAAEIEKLKGIHSRLFPQILGYQGNPEIIHRDNLFIFRHQKETNQDDE